MAAIQGRLYANSAHPGAVVNPAHQGPVVKRLFLLDNVNIPLRERDRYAFLVETEFDGSCYCPISIPVVVGFDPWSDDEVD